MNSRTLRRIWFAGLFLLLPWPMFAFSDAFAPAVHYTLLGGVALAIAIAEGAAGPVGLIVGFFALMAVGTTVACWLLAWGIERLLRNLPANAERAVTFGALALGLCLALVFEPYRTSFGHALTGGLLDVLW